MDKILNEARSDLFLAALQLHQDFLSNAVHATAPGSRSSSSRLIDGLRAASDVIAGSYPHDLEPEKIRAAWQLFFLVVPLISTTFASASRMFGNIGREAIGWLLIDEAGQAAPQYAAGSIWRAKRVIAVGDPLQLEPVITAPIKTLLNIASHYDVGSTWLPPQPSVQKLADRVTQYGTTLHQGEDDLWVSAPLLVHRRCDDPMFSLCNQIAYNNLMVNGVHRKLDEPDEPDLFDAPDRPRIYPSYWADASADQPGSHLQADQIKRFEDAMDYLRRQNIKPADVIAISPFRVVADKLRELVDKYPGLQAGTIHTAQGREAPVVILVLGGDPDKPGTPAVWARTPNMVNVASSSAQRCLYVIGDRFYWSQHNHFRQLAQALPTRYIRNSTGIDHEWVGHISDARTQLGAQLYAYAGWRVTRPGCSGSMSA